MRTAPAPERVSLFRGGNRATTVGLLLVVTLIAYEAMAVATAMPRAVAALHGLAYYGWPFTAFLVANIVGMVLGGDAADRTGPRLPLLAGIGVFTVGLVASGSALDMALFVGGRAIQGLGGGLVIVSVYVVIAEVFDERTRPRMFAALSAAWVVPSLVGPVVAGALTEHLTWRLVFWLIPPLALLSLALIWPALRDLPARERTGGGASRWPYALLAAVGLMLVQYAEQRRDVLSVPVVVVGVAGLVLGGRRLLPRGTVRAARGLPAVIATRGMASGAFFAVDALVPLTLATVHGFTPTESGLPLMLGSLGWSAGSWWQSRHPDAPRYLYIRVGFVFIGVAALAMGALAFAATPGVLAYPVWLVGGSGMGLLMPSVAVLTLSLSPPAERGFNSSALQIADVGTAALCTGLGGALVAVAESGALSFTVAIVIVDAAMAALALLGVLSAGRTRVLLPAAEALHAAG